jgi:hypothetical protein
MIAIAEGVLPRATGDQQRMPFSTLRLGQLSSRLANVIEQLLGFPKDLAHLCSLPKRFFGVGSVLQRILVAFGRARPFSAAMHIAPANIESMASLALREL